jgi:1-acyl-sn-glycerol-3-phosphate acyltransferase
VIDTSDISIHEVVDRILEYKQKKNLKPTWMHLHGVKFFYRITLFSAWLFVKIFYRHRVYGLEHFYPRGAIIAANHTSFLDPPLVSVSWPEEVHFLARDTLFKGWFGKMIRAVNAHPVSGEASDIGVFKTISQLLNEGEKIIIFPEGKRSFDGELGPIKPGIGMLISRTRSAIIPAYVSGAYKIWSRHRKLPKLWGKTICVFGTPIQWHEFSHLEKKEAQEAIANKLTESLLGLKKWLEDGAKGLPP